MSDTRERFVAEATRIFAERGFYGTSIAAIADALPYTKQALLHHFGSKEKLYGEALARISDRLMRDLEAVGARRVAPSARLEETFVEFLRASLERGDETQLLMRELLDNKRRAETARTWYLKPFLERLTALALDDPSGALDSRAAAQAFVYQLLGAINYFVVSQPTLEQMLGKAEFEGLEACCEYELRALIRARLCAADGSR